jgi:hypothetical protein
MHGRRHFLVVGFDVVLDVGKQDGGDNGEAVKGLS